MKAKQKTALFGAMSLVVLFFIFGNSLRSRAESSTQSLGWVALLRPYLDPAGRLSEDMFHSLVRKMAHFAEFFALGVSIGGFSINLGRLRERLYVALPLLLVLAAAVCDEWIQTFTGRAGMVSDIVLDSCGGLTGLMLVAILTRLLQEIAAKRERRK